MGHSPGDGSVAGVAGGIGLACRASPNPNSQAVGAFAAKSGKDVYGNHRFTTISVIATTISTTFLRWTVITRYCAQRRDLVAAPVSVRAEPVNGLGGLI